jgi:hypothetical protein
MPIPAAIAAGRREQADSLRGTYAISHGAQGSETRLKKNLVG